MKEQVREFATEVWQTSHWTNEQIKRLERFYALVRNAALEEAAKVCFAMPAPTHCNRAEANLCDVMTAQCENEIRNLKEPTP